MRATGPNQPKRNLTASVKNLIEESDKLRTAESNPDANLPDSVVNSTVSLSVANPTVLADGTVAGKRVSGSSWKRSRNKVSSMIKLNKNQIMTYEKRMIAKAERASMMEQQDSLKALMHAERDEERRRMEQRRKQKEENEKKGTITQKITNTKKLKKLTPKQMRQITKM